MLGISCFFDGGEVVVGIHMTAARAIPKFADRIAYFGRLRLLVAFTLVIIRMTTSTVRLVGRRQPWIDFRIISMTVIAAEISSVPAGIKRRRMAKHDGDPLVDAMTGIALLRCNKMGRRLTDCCCSIVTIAARSCDILVIKGCARKGIGVVAIVAGITALNMARIFSGSNGAIVATGASPQHRAVVHTGDRCPCDRVMAVLASIECLNMRRRFSGRNRTIVTACAIAGHARVIKHRARKGVGVVTIVAGITALNVTRIFSGSHGAIVATGASALH